MNGKLWGTYYRYDPSGRLILTAQASAVTITTPATLTSAESNPDIVGFNSSNNSFQFLAANSGLITTIQYGQSTTATASAAGDVLGYIKSHGVQNGYSGTSIQLDSRQYFSHTDGNGTAVSPIAARTQYRNTDGTGAETTNYAYSWYSGTNRMYSMSVTYPTIGVSQNGPNTADVETTVYDAYGRAIWTRDGDGYIDYTAYDNATGAVLATIQDVNTNQPGDFANLPSGWTTVASGGLNLTTSYQVDGLGRTTKEIDPRGLVTYWVYDDPDHEVRQYQGWNATTGTTTGPTVVTREDRPGSYTETLTMNAAPATTGPAGSLVPTGTEAIGDIRSLSRTLEDNGGRTIEVDDYVTLGTIAYSTAFHLGAVGTNYYAESYGYDEMGRQSVVTNAVGTIAITKFDALGRASSSYVGTDMTGFWAAGGPTGGNMTWVAAYQYDGGGVGDSNLTQATEYPDANAADARVTQDAYDFRDRLIAVKAGVQANEGTTTHRPIVFSTLDNLGEVVSMSQYDGDGVALAATAPAASLLRAYTTTAYDDQERVYLQSTYSVNQSSGAVSSNALTTSTYYDHRSNVTATYAPGGLVTKDLYDGAGRLVQESSTDGFAGTSWAVANSVGGDHVLSQTLTKYDADGNAVLTTTVDRNHDAPAGLLGNLIPTDATYSTAPQLLDLGFEAIATGGSGYVYAPNNPAWNFTGTAGMANNSAGVSGNGTGFTSGNPNAPQGSQVAFLQAYGTFSQSVAGWAAGLYQVSFSAAQRGNAQSSSEDFEVLVDGKVVGTFRPVGTSYQTYTTDAFAIGAGSHVISFVGLDSNGGDNTAFIDAVAVQQAAVQNGLSATYFSQQNFVGATTTEVDPVINFNWNGSSPAPGIGGYYWSARWTGSILAPTTGAYTFSSSFDNAASLWINGQLIFGNGSNSGTFNLVAGQMYSIRLDYFQVNGPDYLNLQWSGPGVSQAIIPQSALFSGILTSSTAGAVQSGLTGTFYSNQNFTGTTTTQVTPVINFNWNSSSPAAGIGGNNFSAIWKGLILAPTTGTYTFYSDADDAAHLVVNGQALFADPSGGGVREGSGTITLQAGQFYSIELDYFQVTGPSNVNLLWSGPGIDKTLVPQSQLFAGNVVSTTGNARISYEAAYFDAANRTVATVDVGTNGGLQYIPPAQVPTSSDTVLATTYAYDPSGWVGLITDPRGILTEADHDMLGRITQSIAGFTFPGLYTPGSSTSSATPTNSTNATTRYTYDGLDHTLTVTAVLPAGTPSQTTTYVYGVSSSTGSGVASNDLLAAIIQPDKTTGAMPTSNLTANEVTYSYNALGDETGSTDANGTTHQYAYDVLDRQTSDTVTTLGAGVDGTVRRIDTAYDTADRPYLYTSYADTAGITVVNQIEDIYNGLGQLTAEYEEYNGAVNIATTPAVRYQYTEMAGGQNNSRLIAMTYPNGRVLDYLYNSGLDSNISRVSAIADDNNGTPGQILESYLYLGLDSIVEWDHPQTGVNLTYIRQPGDTLVNNDGGDEYTGLDRFGRVIDQNWTTAGGTAARYQYGYDRDGDVLYRADLVAAALSELYHSNSSAAGDDNSAYDALGRLTGFTRGVLSSSGNNGATPDTVSSPTTGQSWSLDALGNWSGTTKNGATTSQTFNANNQATTSTYDNNGDTLSDGTNTYVYDAWNRLVAVRSAATGTTSASYGYDALGRRVTETHGSTITDVYFTPAWQVIEERVGGTATSNVATQYVLGVTGNIVLRDSYSSGSLVSMARLYDLTDANGDVTALVNASGQVVERYAYDL